MEESKLKKLDTFLNSLEISKEKKSAIKTLLANQLDHLVKEEVTVDMIKAAEKMNTPLIKGMNVFTDLSNSIKENFNEFFKEDK